DDRPTGYRPGRTNLCFTVTPLWAGTELHVTVKLQTAENGSPSASEMDPMNSAVEPFGRVMTCAAGVLIATVGALFGGLGMSSSQMPRPCVAARRIVPSRNG